MSRSTVSNHQPAQNPSPNRMVFWINLALFASGFISLVFYLFLIFQQPAWQLFPLIGLAVIFDTATLYSMWLTHQHQTERGIKVTLNTLLVVLMLSSLFIADVGILFGLFGLIITFMIAIQTLNRTDTNRVIIFGVIAAAVASLLGVIQLDFQLNVPQMGTITLLTASLVIVVYALFVIRRFDTFRLQNKLIVTFLLVALIPLALLALVNNFVTRNALTEAANQRLLAAASETAAGLDTFVSDTLAVIEAEAQLPDVIGLLTNPEEYYLSENPLVDTLRALKLQNEHIMTYGLLDRDGRNIGDSESALLAGDESDREYFQTPLRENESYVSPVFLEESGPVIYFSAPVRSSSDEVVGVLRVRYDAAILRELIELSNESIRNEGDRLATERGGDTAEEEIFAILLDENLVRLVDTVEPDLVFKSVVPLDAPLLETLQAADRLPAGSSEELSTNLESFAAGVRNESEQKTFEGVAHPGRALEQGAVAKTEIPPGWFIVFVQPQSAFLRPVEAQGQIILLLALIFGVGAGGVAMLVSRRLSRPIVQLTAAAQRVAEGDLAVQTISGIEQGDETGQLAAAFDQMTAQLRHSIGSLEKEVEERTNDLTLSMQVGQRAATFRDLDTLLPTMTEFIRHQFNLYYVHVYLVDDTGQTLIIRAGTGTVGEALLERRHTLPVGPGSIVGQVAATASSIVVPDTSVSDIHMPNLLLPETRSELAVPLIVEQRVIGVLDMQSDTVNTFTESNKTVFEAMGTQLAIAIDGARQWALAQEAQQRLEATVKHLTREAWAKMLGQQDNRRGFIYDLATVKPMESKPINGESSVPLVVQNETIGHLSVKAPADRALSEDERDLMAAVAQQLAQKAETLRLFEETQRRAAREQLARQITDRIRASRDIETALKTAAEALGEALGTTKSTIDLHIAENSERDVIPNGSDIETRSNGDE